MKKQFNKIAFAGPSGTGKTTLVKHIIEKHNQNWINGSASEMFTPDDREILKEYGYEAKGHANVMALSAANPEFGIEFQYRLADRRASAIKAHAKLVIDRSPIDNIVYFLLQVAPFVTQEQTEHFIKSVIPNLLELDLIIWLRRVNPNVENNGSRIPNVFYQDVVDTTFQMVIENLKSMLNHQYDSFGSGGAIRAAAFPTVIQINEWDLDYRKNLVDSLLKTK